MNKTLLTFVATIASCYAFAQTNTFPSSGSVGIGTTSPSSPLQITGNIGGGDIMQLNNTDATDGRTAILFSSAKGPQRWEFGENIAGSVGLFGVRDLTSSGFPIRFAVNTSGYVGIGTTAQTNMFTVSGNNPSSPGNTATFSSNNGSASTIGNQLNITNLQTNWGMLIGFDGSGVATTTYHGPNAAYLINVQNAPLYFGTNNSQNMMISSAGNVSIGTTDSKGYMLAVNGSAIATSITVKLNANWPDYVFEANYQLPSLQEVKTYIEQNHHLPEMPSAEEVEKNGLNLGETNKVLTKKVEELTLYLIEKEDQENIQNEKIKQLSEQLRSDKTQLQILEARLEKLESNRK